MTVLFKRGPVFRRFAPAVSVLLASALVMVSQTARAGPFDDFVNNAIKAAKTAVDAASAAAANARNGGVPPPPPAPAPVALPNPAPATSAQAGAPATSVQSSTTSRPASSATPGMATRPSTSVAVSPAQPAPAQQTNWGYRVIGGANVGVNTGWTIEEAQDYGGFLEYVNPCASRNVRGSGVNELFAQDMVGRIRVARDYPQMLGQFAIVVAASTEAPASGDAASAPPAVKCLALLNQLFPELGNVQFTYFTFKAGKIVGKTAGLKELLVDGSFDEPGQIPFSPSFASEDLVALGDLNHPKAPAGPQPAAPEAPARVATVTSGKPLPALAPVSRPMQSTFSIGAYEAVALKMDGSVEVRSFNFPNEMNPYAATVGAGRTMPSLHDIFGVRAQATYDTIRIGSISAARDKSGNWIGWRAGAQPIPIAFDKHISTLGMNNVGPPLSQGIVNFAGGRSSLWHLCDDGSVLMASARGVLPGTFAANWQQEHKFTGVTKIVATPGPSGSFRALFLKSDGTVWANGTNFYQGWLQIEGNATEKKMSPMADPKLSPVRLQALSHVRDIAAYWPSTAQGKGAALLEDGSVVTFKINLDVPDTALSNLPMSRVTRFSKARHVAAGSWGVGAVDMDGHVWVWGSNPEVTTEDRRSNVTGFRGGATLGANEDDPTMVPGLSDVVDIDFSTAFAGALRSDGTVWVWNGQAPVKIFDNVKLAQ